MLRLPFSASFTHSFVHYVRSIFSLFNRQWKFAQMFGANDEMNLMAHSIVIAIKNGNGNPTADSASALHNHGFILIFFKAQLKLCCMLSLRCVCVCALRTLRTSNCSKLPLNFLLLLLSMLTFSLFAM